VSWCSACGGPQSLCRGHYASAAVTNRERIIDRPSVRRAGVPFDGFTDGKK
jgi:hypothetical protein